MANIMLPDKAIESLESTVIRMYKDLHPTLGVLISEQPLKSELSYYNSILKSAERYEAKVITERAPSIIQAYHCLNSLIENKDVNGIIIVSEFQGGEDQFLKDYLPYTLDIDCASSNALGHLITDKSFTFFRTAPCTAAAIYKILEYHNIQLEGKKVGIVGRSLRVGRPTADIMIKRNATITLYHSKSDLSTLPQEDIVISAVGKPHFLTEEYFSDGQIVVDVGVSFDPSTKRMCGDVDFDNVCKKIGDSGWITKSPGGVGPMTNAVLFSKLFVQAAKMHASGGEIE